MEPISLLLGALSQGGGAGAGSGLNPLTAALNLPHQIYQGILGIDQGMKAKELGRTERPVYNPPASATEALDMARMRAFDPRLPGQGLMQNQIDLGAAAAMAGASGLGAGSAERLGALMGISNSAIGQTNALSLNAARNRNDNLNALQSALNSYAEYEDRMFRYNQDEPYRNAMAAANQLGDASNQNVAGALRGIGGTVASTIGTQGGPQSIKTNGTASTLGGLVGNALGAASNAVNSSVSSPNEMRALPPVNPGDPYDFGNGNPQMKLKPSNYFAKPMF